MAKKKVETTAPDAKATGAELTNEKGQSVLVWKATRPMTEREHKSLSEKLRYEAEKTGLNIVFVPFSVEPEAGE